MFKRTIILVLAIAWSGAAAAASLSNGDLPEGSNWYLHVNVELMRSTALGQMMMEESIQEAFQEIEQELDVQFSEHVSGLTIFGGQLPPNEGAVIAHGDLPAEVQQRLLEIMAGARRFEKIEHAGLSYYGVDGVGHGAFNDKADSGHRRHEQHEVGGGDLTYVAFGVAQTMFAQSEATVKRFVENGGHLAGLGGSPDALLVIEAERAMMQGGVNTTANLGHGNWDSSILSNVERVAAVLVDENGAASFHADVTAISPEIAESVRNIVEGLVALKALDAADEPALGDLLRSTKISTNGAVITVDVYLEPTLINDLLDL